MNVLIYGSSNLDLIKRHLRDIWFIQNIRTENTLLGVQRAGDVDLIINITPFRLRSKFIIYEIKKEIDPKELRLVVDSIYSLISSRT